MSSATTVRKKTIKIDKDAVRKLDVSALESISINSNDWLLLVRVSIVCMLGCLNNLITPLSLM